VRSRKRPFDEVGLEGRPTSEVRRRVERVLGPVALLARRRHRPHELSGGEMQRVAVARALVIDPADSRDKPWKLTEHLAIRRLALAPAPSAPAGAVLGTRARRGRKLVLS
jgi:hypothetical protein